MSHTWVVDAAFKTMEATEKHTSAKAWIDNGPTLARAGGGGGTYRKAQNLARMARWRQFVETI